MWQHSLGGGMGGSCRCNWRRQVVISLDWGREGVRARQKEREAFFVRWIKRTGCGAAPGFCRADGARRGGTGRVGTGQDRKVSLVVSYFTKGAHTTGMT